MKNRILTCVALALVVTHAAAAPTLLAQIQAEMRARQYDKAAALADQAVAAAKDSAADQALLLKATALLQSKKFAEALSATDQLLADFPQSVWRHKAVFLKAQTLIEQKQFAAAAAIYQAEAARILAPERKQALVGEILRFAEKLETKPDPNVPDAPKPDFAKAYSLYTKALAHGTAARIPRRHRLSQGARHPTGRQRRPGHPGSAGLPHRI